MDQIRTSRGDTPAFKLLEPAQRVVMGLIAAIGMAAAGYFIFVPLSDASAIQLARRGDAGSSGYAGGSERLAAARRRATDRTTTALRPAATPDTRTGAVTPDAGAPI